MAAVNFSALYKCLTPQSVRDWIALNGLDIYFEVTTKAPEKIRLKAARLPDVGTDGYYMIINGKVSFPPTLHNIKLGILQEFTPKKTLNKTRKPYLPKN